MERTSAPSSRTDPARVRPADAAAVAKAARLLQAGRLVAFPTETVYGLGADARNDDAVARIFAVKARPRFNPLIVHVRDIAAAAQDAMVDARARSLAEAFWPGPLTLVLPRRKDSRVSLLASAGLDTLALRAPRHPVAQDLLARFGGPIAAPSANPSGRVSPTTAEHVRESLGHAVDLILDGGPCAVGIESTILDLTGERPLLLRPGAVTREEIEALSSKRPWGPLAPAPRERAGEAKRSPGRLERHYAPRHALRLDAHEVTAGEALLAFGPDVPQGARYTLNLSPTGDLAEAARNLFAMLRALDGEEDVAAIAVMPIPEEGLGLAINDRLRRAARGVADA